jgi:hypothetical protein
MPKKPSLMEKVSRGATPYLGSARPPCHTYIITTMMIRVSTPAPTIGNISESTHPQWVIFGRVAT